MNNVITRTVCPVCDEGILTPSLYEDTFYNGVRHIVVRELEYYECDSCDATPIFADQVRRNHDKIMWAKHDTV